MTYPDPSLTQERFVGLDANLSSDTGPVFIGDVWRSFLSLDPGRSMRDHSSEGSLLVGVLIGMNGRPKQRGRADDSRILDLEGAEKVTDIAMQGGEPVLRSFLDLEAKSGTDVMQVW